MKNLGYILLVLLLSAVTYVVFYFIRQNEILAQTCFSFGGFKMIGFRLKKATAELKLSIKNKSDIPITIISQNYNIYINDKFVSKIKNNDTFSLPKDKKIDTTFIIEFKPFETIGMAIGGIFSDTSKTSIRAEGYAMVTVGFLRINRLPVDINFTVKQIIDMSKGKKEPC